MNENMQAGPRFERRRFVLRQNHHLIRLELAADRRPGIGVFDRHLEGAEASFDLRDASAGRFAAEGVG